MDILREVKERLKKVYGNRLKGVVLYGSEARGEAQVDSDIDFLVILSGKVDLGEDLKKIIHTLYPLQLEILRPISALPVEEAEYEAGEYSLYQNAKREGIFA